MPARSNASHASRSSRGPSPRPDGLVSRAYQQLRDSIVRGYLAPGTRITESDVTERLGISRTPVRSALHDLQRDGFVHCTRVGVKARLVVAPLTKEDAFELYAIIAEVEALAAGWAAELPSDARDSLVEDLRRLNQELAELARPPELDTETIFDVHTGFHWRFVAAAPSPRLQRLHMTIKPHAERYRRIYSAASPDNILASCSEHDILIQSISAGDAEAARASVRMNWRNSATRVARLIDRSGALGSWSFDSNGNPGQDS